MRVGVCVCFQVHMHFLCVCIGICKYVWVYVCVGGCRCVCIYLCGCGCEVCMCVCVVDILSLFRWLGNILLILDKIPSKPDHKDNQREGPQETPSKSKPVSILCTKQWGKSTNHINQSFPYQSSTMGTLPYYSSEVPTSTEQLIRLICEATHCSFTSVHQW